MTSSNAPGALECLVTRMVDDGLNGSVVAGHYSVAPSYAALSSDASIEQKSFEYGINLVALSNRIGGRAKLVLWVNDIGIDLAEREALKESYALPMPYRRIAERLCFDPADIEVVFESTMRNKGSTLIRRYEKRTPQFVRRINAATTGLVRCVDDDNCEIGTEGGKQAMVITGPRGEDLVLKEGSHPKCCLILATLFKELQLGGCGDYIVNVFNELYEARLAYGVHVARTLFQLHLPIYNAFVDESGLYTSTAA